MSSEASTFAEEASNNMLKELQSWWEIPSMAQYISLFRDPFNLPEIEIEELEKGFIEDTINGPNEWLQNLIIAFLKSIMPGRVNANNWEVQLRRLIRRKWSESPFDEKENPFQEDKSFHELQLRSKVEVVYCFCLYRFDLNDTQELMKSMDAEALRCQKLGVDDEGNTYWYFYGTRLYKDKVIEEKKHWEEEWEELKNKAFKKRKRGRPPKRQPLNEESVPDEENGFMNANENSCWGVACNTIEDWVNLAEKLRNSKSQNEKSLFQIIQENFLPTLSQIYEEKERKLKEKIRELLPVLPVREKIVTRRETRRLRGENVETSYAKYDYSSDDESVHKTTVIKDRGQRLEERRKRASEAECLKIIYSRKRVKQDNPSDVPKHDSSFLSKPETKNFDLQLQMEKLLSSVKLHKDAWPFLYPVNDEDAPGYYEIIKDPIDLSKIEARLYKGDYETVGDLDADFSKMVTNCELYNGECHAYSKMAQTLRKMFRKEVAKILDDIDANERHSDSEGSNDSQYHSNSDSSSPSIKSSAGTSEKHKPKKGNKRKKSVAEALDLLAQASDIALQNSNTNDMLNISDMHNEQKRCNDFPNLKIFPVHSHPPSFIEKYSSNSSNGSPKESDVSYANKSLYMNQEPDINAQYLRSSPTDSGISTSSETTNYMHNLSHLANFIEKDGAKNLNLLSNSDVTNALVESHSSHSSSTNEQSPLSESPDNLHGLNNILNDYPDNFISHLMKQPGYNSDSELVSQSKDNCSPPVGILPKQDFYNKSSGKSLSFVGHSTSDNIPARQGNINMQYDSGSPSSNITTVDASVLGISLNPLTKKPRNSNIQVNQNHASVTGNENTVPNALQQEFSSKKSYPFKPKQQTFPNEMNQYYESSNLLNQAVNVPHTSYQPLNVSNSSNYVPSAFLQTFATNSASNMPIHVSASYPESVQQQATVHMQAQNSMQVTVPQSNEHVMFVPESNKGSTVTYHVYAENKHNKNLAEEHINYLTNGSTAVMQMETNAEKRIVNQDNFESRASPPKKKSPVPQEVQSSSFQVPSTNMPYNPSSPSISNVNKSSSPITDSSFIHVNSVVQGAKKTRPVIVKAKKAPGTEKRTPPVQNIASTSFNTISNVNSNNMHQNTVHQSLSPKNVPIVISGYNQSPPLSQNDLRFKNNSTTATTMQSNMCLPNGLPVVQQVLIPAGSQQIQIPNNGQFVFASTQNTIRQLNQNFGKVVPQIVSSAPVMQISKDGMQNLQFQTLSPNNTQPFAQVAQSPQFVNIPYMLTNQNIVNNSSPQSVMNFQPYQLTQRQIQINGQGNG